MGDFRITIDAVGGHGCARETKSGERPYRCGRDNCPDCQTVRFVEQLVQRGCQVNGAKLEHWPEKVYREHYKAELYPNGIPTEDNPNPGPIDKITVAYTPAGYPMVEQVRLGSFNDTPYLLHAKDATEVPA